MKKILIVDDDEGVLGALEMLLSDEGYSVMGVASESQVYKAVSDFKPDMIILDVLLSGSDGRTICKKLKNNPETLDIPVVMASAHPTAEREIKKYKADDFLAKPFGLYELNEKLSKYLKN